MVWKISCVTAKQKEFQSKLPSYLSNHGVEELKSLTTDAGDTLVAGVANRKLIPLRPLCNG